jgi:hypothetical protein
MLKKQPFLNKTIMKNQKLKLDELKVQSFVTDFDKTQDQTQEINGGATDIQYCLKNIVLYELPKFTKPNSWAGGCTTTYIPDFRDRYRFEVNF